MSNYNSYRLSYYEDDVVQYSKGGHRPKLPEKYKYCTLNKRKYKSFFTEEEAKISLQYKMNDGKKYFGRFPNYIEPFVIFKCRKCGMYHIIHKTNFDKLMRKYYGKDNKRLHTTEG